MYGWRAKIGHVAPSRGDTLRQASRYKMSSLYLVRQADGQG